MLTVSRVWMKNSKHEKIIDLFQKKFNFDVHGGFRESHCDELIGQRWEQNVTESVIMGKLERTEIREDLECSYLDEDEVTSWTRRYETIGWDLKTSCYYAFTQNKNAYKICSSWGCIKYSTTAVLVRRVTQEGDWSKKIWKIG